MTVISLGDLALYFLKLGSFGFGGPIALVSMMQRDLTERRYWFTSDEFRESLVFAQLAPGPLAAQVAMYLGWLRHRVIGATVVGTVFVLPSFLIVLLLAIAYQRVGGLPWLRAAFYGINAAVIVLIGRGAIKLARLTLKNDPLLLAVFAVNAAVTVITRAEPVLLVLLSGASVALFRMGRSKTRLVSIAPLPALLFLQASVSNGSVFWFFLKAGALVFGSGLAIVPFLYATVQPLQWLTEQQFLDAVAVSMITPGPVVITVAFMGYLVGDAPGALVAAIAVFLPVYLSVLIGAPFFQKWSAAAVMRALVAGLAAAATGALAGAAVLLGHRALTDWLAFAIAGLTVILLVRFPRLPEPVLIGGAGLLGLLARS